MNDGGPDKIMIVWAVLISLLVILSVVSFFVNN